jgi:hypothetical protein
MSKQLFWFNGLNFSTSLIRDLRRMNPWWEGHPLPLLPLTRRHLVGDIQKRLALKLAPIVVLRGPRQIGKTIAQLHVIQDLLNNGISPTHILRVQCDELPTLSTLDEPILRIVDWYEESVLQKQLNQAAHDGEPTYLLFDEVQNLKNWAPQLKALVDMTTTHVIVTGSSALRIEIGRDSLAGRITNLDAGVLSLTEIGSFYQYDCGTPFLGDNQQEALGQKEFWRDLVAHGLQLQASRDFVFKKFADRGGYPLVHQKADVAWDQVAAQLNETVIRRVIQHDLRLGERGRKRDAPLLEEVFKLGCRYIGQTPSTINLAREIQRTLDANIGPQRVSYYLKFLADTLLLRLIDPLEIRLKRQRGNSKICLADHGLRASWLQEIVPLDTTDLQHAPHLSTLAGHIAESVVGTTLSTISGLPLAHLSERNSEPEVDFVMTIGTRRIPIEVKYQRKIDFLGDTRGLRSFIEKAVNNAPFGLLITQIDMPVIEDPRIVVVPLSSLMLLR